MSKEWKRDRLRVAAVAVVGIVVAMLGMPTGAGAVESEDEPPKDPPCAPVLSGAAVKGPEITAKSWAVLDADTGRILASCRGHLPMPPASTQKVLTALALLPHLDPQARYVARKQDVDAEGTQVGLLAGRSYTIKELSHALALRSGNDAASAIANAFGGWGPALAAMNAEARRLHANETRARNPSGLDSRGQVSSACDLAHIFQAAMRNSRLRSLFGTRTASFPLITEREVGGDPKRVIREVRPGRIETIDPMVRDGFRGLVGGKTGFTTRAGRTYVGAVQQGGRTLVIAMMRHSEDTKAEARTLFSWAMANASRLPGVETVMAAEAGTGGDGAPAARPPARPSASRSRVAAPAMAPLDLAAVAAPIAGETRLWALGILVGEGLIGFGLVCLWVARRPRVGSRA